ncbi:MAG: ankyrin repeat protein [Rickettsiales bacterium]|jgi:ankyrin repeat protein|nr:ankyrin repeat protein [Rickettsiales bacterium]
MSKNTEHKLFLTEEEKHQLNKLLWKTVRDGNLPQMRVLIKVGADIHAVNKRGFPILGWADKEEVVKFLIENGLDIKAMDKKGSPSLCWAQNEEVAQFLSQNGADVNAVDAAGRTPLHATTNRGYESSWVRFRMATFFIEKGAKVNAPDELGYTPLHLAIEGLSELFIKNGADVNAKNKKGFTPLHLAAEDSHCGKAKFLIKKGADVNAKNNEGFTPLDLATFKYSDDDDHDHWDYYNDMIELLIKGGADANTKNKEGFTLLHLVISRARDDNWKNVEFLIKNGADVNAQNKEGFTPLNYAVMGGHEALIKLLLSAGAHLEQPDVAQAKEWLGIENDSPVFDQLFGTHQDAEGNVYFTLRNHVNVEALTPVKFRQELQKDASDEVSSIMAKMGGGASWQILYDIFTEHKLSKSLFNDEDNTKNLNTLKKVRNVAKAETSKLFSEKVARRNAADAIGEIIEARAETLTETIEASRMQTQPNQAQL